MTIKQTKSLLRRIVNKGHQFLLKVITSNKTNCKHSENDNELKLDMDGNYMMGECDQSTRDDQKMHNITNNSGSNADFSQIIDQNYSKESTSVHTKKRYYRIVYYKGKNEIENIQKEEAISLQQQRNNKRQRQIQGCEGLPNPNKKFIDNQKIVRTKERTNQNYYLFKNENINYEESRIKGTVTLNSNSTEMRERFKHVMCNKEQDIFPAKLIIRQRQISVKSTRQRDNILDHNAPQLGQYVLNYYREDFLNMNQQQLKNVPNLMILNQFACLEFLEPVSLYRKNIEKSIHIENKALFIYDQDWKDKMFQLTFYNFDHYTSKTVIDKIEAKQFIFNFASLNNSKIINFDETRGDLTLLQNQKMQEEKWQY